MVKLSVNVNKVATLRNARGGTVPDVVQAALKAVEAGCHGITVHPRPDERHIRRQDVFDLAAALAEGVELNIEGYPAPEWLELVEAVRPHQATLVPDSPDVLTSNAGWRLDEHGAWLREEIVPRLKHAGCRVSLFLEPDAGYAAQAAETGADRVELYTEQYARAYATGERDTVFATYALAAQSAVDAGLGVNAGHDLNLENLSHLAVNLPGLAEVSIGHALISDALYMGLENAVHVYLAAIESHR
ncbi:MAG: pyridoxine 5'-phosphate synthase [Thermoanaerobaculia bacterium]